MPIGGSATEFNITGAKLKVSGGVQVTGSIAYTSDATGFGGVTAQIDGNNTLNVTSGKLTGVTKIERSTAATITAITHTNVNNNTTIHIALKNTSSTRGVFITLGTFASDDTVKVNYTDDYLIGPGETGMLTLRKVNGVLSLFAREMFSDKASTFTDDNTNGNRPFYIKDGVNYKYPLYKFAAAGLTSEVIQGTTYFKPTAGITTKTRPPKGIPENVTPPSASGFAIGNNAGMTTLEYSVLGVSSNFDYASITDGNNATQTRFILTDGEASGTFTESGVSSGDSYKLFIEKTNTNLTDTVSAVPPNSQPLAVFHNGTFSDGDDPYSHGSVTAAATAGYFYSDTASGTYGAGTLTSATYTASSGNTSGDLRSRIEAYTTYVWTPTANYQADVLIVAGGGGGGADMGGGGGAGGYLEASNQSISGTQTIIVGDGGIGQTHDYNQTCYSASDGGDSSISGTSHTAIGGGGGGSNHNNISAERYGRDGGSGGGSSGNFDANQQAGSGTVGQGHDGALCTADHYGAGGGGAGEVGRTYTASENIPGDGGDGKQSDILGTTYWWSGGGGGASHSNAKGGGGKGGGGSGAFGGSVGGGGLSDTNGVSDAETTPGSNGSWHQRGSNAGKHTGGGAGGGSYHNGNGGKGGSGMVVIKDVGSGKKIPKVKDITLDSTNDSNVVISTQGTGISTVTYSVNGGSEVSTPVSQLSVAHGLSVNTTGTLLAYALNASSARLGVKLSKSITRVYGYETITLLTKSGSQTIVYVDNGTTNVTNTYKSAGGNTWNGGWYMATGYTAPVTFEYKASAANSDDGQSYKQIGISDSVVQTYGTNDQDIFHYAYYQSAVNLSGADIGSSATASGSWNSTDTFYIVYKTNGNVEWWQAGTKFKTIAWGTGKTVYLSTTLWKQSNGSDNGTVKNVRIKRREWDGTKYIN